MMLTRSRGTGEYSCFGFEVFCYIKQTDILMAICDATKLTHSLVYFYKAKQILI